MSDDSSEHSYEGETAPQVKFSEVAKEVIRANIVEIGQGLHVFWNSHSAKLKSSLVNSRQSSVF